MCISRINITCRNIYTCSIYAIFFLFTSSRIEIKYSARLLFSLILYCFLLFFFPPERQYFYTGSDYGITFDRYGFDPLFLWFRFRISVDRTFSSVIDRRRWLPAISVAMRGERRCHEYNLEIWIQDADSRTPSSSRGWETLPRMERIDQKIGRNCCAI